MVLDGHIHIAQRNCKPKDMKSILKAAGIDGGILLSLRPDSFILGEKKEKTTTDERLDNLFMWTDVNKNLYPFFWIDPMEDNALEQVALSGRMGVMGYKIICNSFYPYDEKAMRVYKAIAEQGKPILFHSGILWGGGISSIYSRPVGFEALLEIKGLKFALAHISWPWCDECIAVYGRFLNTKERRPDITSEMYIDITPGTPPVYRRDALTKLLTVGYDVENNIIFGLDNVIEDYDLKNATEIIANDNLIYDELGVSAATRNKIYGENMKRFLG